MRKLLSVILLMGILTGCTGSKSGSQLTDTPSSPATPAGPAAGSIPQELTVDGIHLGSTADEVERTLGRPERVTPLPQQASEAWLYPARGLVIIIWARKLVLHIAIEAPSKLRTLKGIGIGDPVLAVTEAYGPGKDGLRYQLAEHVWILFSERDGRVTRIALSSYD